MPRLMVRDACPAWGALGQHKVKGRMSSWLAAHRSSTPALPTLAPCSPASWLLKTQNGMRRCCRLFNPRGWICYDVAPAAPSG